MAEMLEHETGEACASVVGYQCGAAVRKLSVFHTPPLTEPMYATPDAVVAIACTAPAYEFVVRIVRGDDPSAQ